MKEGDALDEILVHIGDFGKHQTIAFVLICIVVVFNSATHMAYVFTAMDSEYRCLVPQCDNPEPKFQEKWLDIAIPSSSTNKSRKCDMYATFPNLTLTSDNCSVVQFDRSHLVTCSEHVFKDDEHYIAREYGLLCEDQIWKLSLVGTFNSAGCFFGLLLTGIVSDRYGRKIVLLMGMMLCGAAGIIKAYAITFEWFCFMEFMEALLAAGSYGSGFILGVELVIPENRVRTSSFLFSCYAIGEVFVAAVAWAVRDWRLLLYIIYGPCILLTFFYWSIPESVRWYLSKGEIEKPRKILKKFAKSSGKSLQEKHFHKLNRNFLEKQDENETLSFMDMIKSVKLFLRLVNCGFLWMACSLLFYGITLNSVTLAGNSYLDFILISLTEIPAYWCVYLVVEKIGRKLALCGSFVITSASCLGFILIERKDEWLHMLVYCSGKFGATSAFILIYVITSELFPTPIRHTTMGICSMIGRVGSIVSPQIPLLVSTD
ncbi:hypothetical protein WA026_005533 [Henosepilachna vigintioctopunctata]|uniref:Major facilitator superfamily (MFS) profile domain-containing protein n=1 Tax=Henosepilachna vigintioctopunctata TaxID=420089 RepID=A0AAW1U3H5_9CUCU